MKNLKRKMGINSTGIILLIFSFAWFCYADLYALNQIENSGFVSDTSGWDLAQRLGTINPRPRNPDRDIVYGRSVVNSGCFYANFTSDGNNRDANAIISQQFTVPAGSFNIRLRFDHRDVENAAGYEYHYLIGTIRRTAGTYPNETIENTFYSDFLCQNTAAWSTTTSAITLAPGDYIYRVHWHIGGDNNQGGGAYVDNLRIEFSPEGLNGGLNGAANSLSWNNSSSPFATVDHYNIYYSTTSGGPYSHNPAVDTSVANSYSHASPPAGAIVYYVVTDVDTEGFESPYSFELPVLRMTVNDGTGSDLDYISGDEVSMNWLNNVGAVSPTGYEVALGTTPGGSDVVGWTAVSAALTDYTFTGQTLANSTTYYCSIRVVTATRTLNWSSSDGFMCIKSQVRDGNAADVDFISSLTDADMNWDAVPAPISRYEVALGTAPGATDVINWTDAGLATSYSFSGLSLSDGGSYYASMRVLDPSLAVMGVFTSDGFAPAVSYSTTVRDGTGADIDFVLSPISVDLNWDDVVGFPKVRYEAALGTTPGGSDVAAWTDMGLATSGILSGFTLSEGVTYYCSVRIVHDFGTLAADSSDGFVYHKFEIRDGPGEDVDFSVLPGTAEMNWDNPALPISRYEVAVSVLPGGSEVTGGWVNMGMSTSASLGGLSLLNGTMYYCSVRAIDGGGSVISTVFSDGFIYTQISNITVRDGLHQDISESFLENLVEFNWDHPPSGIIRYEVAVGTVPFGTDVRSWTSVGHANQARISGVSLASGTTYYAGVRGINAFGLVEAIGGSDGFVARRDQVLVDTAAQTYFHNARVAENIDFTGVPGSIRPRQFSNAGGANNYWRYRTMVTVTEPGVTERINAPCRIQLAIPAGQMGNIRELRVADEAGNEVPRTNINTSVTAPDFVFLVNMAVGETKNYWVYWGNAGATDPAYGFTNTATEVSSVQWTPYYSRKNVAPGAEEPVLGGPLSTNDDQTVTPPGLPWAFYYFGANTTAWRMNTNGFLCTNNVGGATQYQNRWATFVGNTYFGRCITPMWSDLWPGGGSPDDAGIYRNAYGDRVVYTWRANRFGVRDDIYIIQAVLRQTSDIELRYSYLSTRGVIGPAGTYDRPANTENTVGISNCDNTRWLRNTPLIIGIGKSPTAFYQCADAFRGNYTVGPISGGAAGTWVEIAHFESMVFDARTANPIWQRIEYDCSGNANNRLVISTRNGPTPLPEMGGWSAWAPAATVTAPGQTPLSYTERYIQYQVSFQRNNTAGALPELSEVRFVHGGISIEEIIANTPNGVSQGQSGIPVEVKIRNFYSQPVDLTDVELTFSLGTYTQSVAGLPVSIPAGDTVSVFFTVNVDINSPIGTATVDAIATATAVGPDMTFTDSDAQYPHEWRVRSKAQLVIKEVETSESFVNKGQTDIFVRMLIANLGETPFTFDSADLTFTLGLYNPPTMLQSPAFGTVIPELSEFIATFTVNIDPLSPSGVAIIDGIASGTSTFSGLVTSDVVASITDSWTIQNPAQMVLEEVVASTTVYRGQINTPVFLRVSNLGEATARWVSSSIIPYLTLGIYDLEYPITSFDNLLIPGGFEATARYGVDISPVSTVGTSIVDASVSGIDTNVGSSIGWTNALIPGEWTILAEKINTFKDAAFTQPSVSFNRPTAGTLTIFAQAENLNPYSEFVVRWFDPADSLVFASPPLTADASGTVSHQFDIDSASAYGNYKVKITNPTNTVISCENQFEVTSPAVLGAHFSMPLRVTVGQSFVASFTFDNSGGAAVESAYVSPLQFFGPGSALQISADPPLTDIPGNSQATVTYNFTAQTAGNFSASATAYGFDANSGLPVTSPAVTSNVCIIENPPAVSIVSITAVPTTVYLNQKNLQIQVVVRNNGQATTVLETASISFNIGSYQQELTSHTLPYELTGGGSTVTFTYNVSVDPTSATGLDVFFAVVKWYDKNWRENEGTINGTPPSDSWTINPVGIILSNNLTYNPTQDDFNRQQTVYIRAYGLTPLSNWYRVRVYNSQINQQATSPAGWIVPPSPQLSADADGYVDHLYTIPVGGVIGVWSVVIETDPDQNGNTAGPMIGLQYFNVQNPGNLVASLTISPSSVFVGENFTVTMLASNTVNSGSTIRNASPAVLVDAALFAGFAGSATQLSGPSPASQTIRALETKTISYTYRADADTGLSGGYRLTVDPAWYIGGYDVNTGALVQSGNGVSNPLIIYSRRLQLIPDSLDFLTLECGQRSAVDATVKNIGNYPLDHVKWITTDMNGPGGLKISKSNLAMSPNPVNGLAGGMDKAASATLFIPYNKEAGNYIATMSVYNDRNLDDLQGVDEAYDLFNVKVVVPPCKKIYVSQDFIDLGAWPVGQTTVGKPVNYFSGGNIALDNVKMMQTVGTNTAHFPFVVTPDNIGPMPITGSGIASATAQNVANPGYYIATWTIWNDENGSGGIDAGEASDTFQLRILVGIMNYTLVPLTVNAGTVEPSGLNTGFGLTLSNDAAGLPLTKLRLDAYELTDGLGHSIASENVAIYQVVNPIPATVNAGQSIPVDLALFVPSGTYAGTYTGTQYIYHDDNGNGKWDPAEFRAAFDITATVPLVPKVQVMAATVGLGGIAPGTSKIVSFSCRNTGNVDLTGLMWEKVNLLSGANVIAATNASFPPSEMFSVPIGEFFTRQIEVTVPPGQPHGVYQSVPGHFWLFADMAPTLNGVRSVGEAQSNFVVTCEVGDLLVDIQEASLAVSGGPNSLSTSATINARNIGSLALVNLKATGSVLIPSAPGPINIEAVQNVFSPATLGGATAGQSKSTSWAVSIPANASAGVYLGTVTVYEDSNYNNRLDAGEAFDQVPVELTVQSQPAIDVVQTLLDLEYVGKNNSKSGLIEIRNAGNVPINSLYFVRAPLVFGANSIPVASITIQTDPAMPRTLAVGASTLATVTVTIGAVQGAFTYSGIQRIFEDLNTNLGWDGGGEVSDTFELRITVGEKVIYETNLSNPPLDFGPSNVLGNYSQSVTVYSGSAVPLPRVRCNVLEPLKGLYYTFPVASLTFTPMASQFFTGFSSRIYSANVEVGFPPAGLYVATAAFYDDDDNDSALDPGEASATFNVYLTVNPVHSLNVWETEYDFGKIEQGAAASKEIMFQNTGNIQLSNFSWVFSALQKAPDQIEAVNLEYSMTFSPDPVLPGEYGTSTVTINVPAAQVLGIYGPTGPQNLQSADGTNPFDSTTFVCEVISGGVPTFEIATNSLFQEIATKSFAVTAPDNNYFMSAWVCPGTGSADISFVTYNEFGQAVGTVSVSIDAAGTLTAVGAPMTVGQSGILEKVPFKHPEHSETMFYYRIFVEFDYTHDPALASNTRIILGNSSPATGLGRNAVWFDGLQLERKTRPDQDRPTAYHSRQTIFSPTKKSTLSGEERYYEW